MLKPLGQFRGEIKRDLFCEAVQFFGWLAIRLENPMGQKKKRKFFQQCHNQLEAESLKFQEMSDLEINMFSLKP